jgi:serine/threonine protein kinase
VSAIFAYSIHLADECSVTDAPPILPKTCGDGVTTLSSAFISLVAQCLAKNPASRPSAGELLQSPFFRSAKKKSYLVSNILKDLPPLTTRQERRKLASAHPTRISIGSWDFAHSPTATMDGRWKSGMMGPASGWATPRTIGSGSRSRAHSRAVSVDALALQEEAEPAFAHEELHDGIQRLQLSGGYAQAEEHAQYLPAVISSSPEPEDELDLPSEVPAPSSSASSDEPSPLVTPSSTPPSQSKTGVWGKLRGKDSKPKASTERKLSKSGGLSGLLTRTISRK